MATHIIHPQQYLDPGKLDDFLEHGWRPTGQSIYTSDYLRADDDELHGCLQLRLPLHGFVPKKRHRKLLRRNRSRFRVDYRKADYPDPELYRVNRLYMEVHPEKSREDLEYSVFNESGERVLDTHVIRVYDGDKLVAFSYYDLGERVIYTKAGIYDPAFAEHSLGLYTMLLEIELGVERGLAYYYPGYYSPTFPAFDYKKQFGPMEYREITSAKWEPLPGLDDAPPTDPLAVNRDCLLKAYRTLRGVGIPAELREYPSFTGRFRPTRNNPNQMLDAPLLLLVGRPLPMEFYRVVTYDNERQRYRYDIVRSASLYDMRVQLYSQTGQLRFTTPVLVHRRLTETADAVRLGVIVRESLR